MFPFLLCKATLKYCEAAKALSFAGSRGEVKVFYII